MTSIQNRQQRCLWTENVPLLGSEIPGVSWGSLPSAYQPAWNSATLNCNTVLANGFKIKHPTNGLYIATVSAGDVVGGVAALRYDLSATPAFSCLPLNLHITRLILKNKASTKLFRQNASYAYEQPLGTTTSDFAFTIVKALGGSR
jgi:hypothetical protein